MADHEVEEILNEIRERVRAEAPPAPMGSRATQASGASITAGRGTDGVVSGASGETAEAREAADAMARLEANLATAERAWNKLPPLMSYRSGLPARIELWLKRQIKRATHWFTWEQVNFNAATFHALRDALSALRAYERHLSRLETELNDARNEWLAQRAEWDAHRVQWEAARAAFETETRMVLDANAAQLQEQRAYVESLRAEQQARLDERATSVQTVVQSELRERIEHLLEEQRVCFRQLALEAGETAVQHDRTRRDTESRLAEFEKRLEAVEKP